MCENNIEFAIIKPEDGEKIVKFLFEHFYPYGPLGTCEPKREVNDDDRIDILTCIAYGCSIMAIENGQLVGVNIALPKRPSSVDEYFARAKILGNTKSGEIFKLIGIANRDANIFQRYGVDEILYLYFTSVAVDQRGRNIAALMTRELMALGKQWNYKVLTVDCASYYCGQVCARLGMECLNTIVFREYKDENGKPIFIPAAPHVEMKTYGMIL